MSTGEHNPATWIVVGVDGSPESASAVHYAADEALRLGAGLRLVHAMPVFPRGIGPRVITSDAPSPTGRAILAAASDIAQRQADAVPIECRLLVGDRRDALISATDGALEIVLGHDPAPSLLRLATGSTAIPVAARASVPVVVVPAAAATTTHHRVGVGIKDPHHAAPLSRRAFQIASDREAILWLVHAWELPRGYEALAATNEEREEITKSAVDAVEDELVAIADEFPGVKYKLTVVHGNPARTLEEVSRSCDLLMLSRRGHILPRGHIGGTARALLHHAACPLMFLPAVPAPLKQSQQSDALAEGS